MNLIAKHFVNLEFEIKNLTHVVWMNSNKNQYIDNSWLLNKRLQDALQRIAPYGLTDYESDIYYIIHLLRLNTLPPMFDEDQQKQWLTYYNEITAMFSFYGLPGDIDLSYYLTSFNKC